MSIFNEMQSKKIKNMYQRLTGSGPVKMTWAYMVIARKLKCSVSTVRRCLSRLVCQKFAIK